MAKRWVLLASIAVLLVGCGGGGSKNRPPQLYIPITQLNATGVLGVRLGEANLPIVNTGGESLTFELTLEDWMDAAFTSASVPVGGTSIVNIQMECVEAGIRRGSIGITTNDPEFESGSVPVELICSVPALEFTLITKNPVEANVGETGQGLIEWSVDSPWEDQPAVGYVVRSDQANIEISNSRGNTEMEERIENTLTFSCEEVIDEEYPITIELGANTFVEDINVNCSESEESIRIAFYQGPLVAWLDVEDGYASSRILTFTQNIPFVPSRSTAMLIESTQKSGATARIFNDVEFEREIHPLASESNFEQLESGLMRMRTVFELPTELIGEEANIHVVVSNGAVDAQDRMNRTFTISMAEFEFANTEELSLSFVPILRDGSRPRLDPDPLIDWLIDTLPIAHASFETLSPMSFDDNEWSLEFAAEKLFARYAERGNFDEFLIGVYDDHGDAACGAAFENLPLLLISPSGRLKCGKLGTFAYRMGQSLGITQTAGCAVPPVLPDELPVFESMRFDSRNSTLMPAPISGGDFVSECNTDAISSDHYGHIQEMLLPRGGTPLADDVFELARVFTVDWLGGSGRIEEWDSVGLMEVKDSSVVYPFSRLNKSGFAMRYEGRSASSPQPTTTAIALGRLTLNNRFYSIGTTNERHLLDPLQLEYIHDHVSGNSSRTPRSWKVPASAIQP